jgi:pimeloyl-ACP methyl ester carboxylesterase
MRIARRLVFAGFVIVALLAISFWLRPVSYFNALIYLREDLSGAESHYVRVDGIRVHYLAEGPASGPVVVLVHGLGSRAEDWRNLAPYAVDAGFRVYLPDLPGYGRSQKPAGFSYSVRDQAAVVVAFLDALGLKQVDLGGWSMGGWIAELIAAQHPERVNRLMLFDAAGLNVKPTWNTDLFVPRNPTELDELDALLMPDPGQIPGYIARDILRSFRRNGWVIRRAMNSMLTARDVTDNLLPQLKMPVLIEWGALDRITPVAEADMMHRLIPQSQLKVTAGCGHLAPLQCAPQIGPQVAAFLRQ